MKNYSSVLIIYNPSAYKGKIEDFIPYIKKRLSLRYTTIDAMSSPELDGAEKLAFKYASKYDIVISCGGDGTFRRTINGVIKSGANSLIGVLPFGTCNDVANSLGIPKAMDKAIDCILRLNQTKFDIFFDGTDYSAYSLATGYLTKSTYKASEKSKKKLGRFAYFLSAIKYMFKFSTVPMTVVADGERIHGKFTYFMLMNGERAGGFKLNKGDNMSDGKLKMVLIKDSNFIVDIFNFAKLFMFGIDAIKKNKNVIVRDVKTIEIENPSNTPFVSDGEKIKFLKKKIQVSDKLTIIKK